MFIGVPSEPARAEAFLGLGGPDLALDICFGSASSRGLAKLDSRDTEKLPDISIPHLTRLIKGGQLISRSVLKLAELFNTVKPTLSSRGTWLPGTEADVYSFLSRRKSCRTCLKPYKINHRKTWYSFKFSVSRYWVHSHCA
ncbi:hypothetical protein AVEN_139553-1 [Araneus ventricosus]|uniref:Uncharacterized protein n=1 Tax=Araneus ventricosus TaxID=182803 RepID=A0A4Y2PW83_ARAVE|nr:hypothetical protein AVEN_139553-1 [Araneus ventricosus]